jgi:hypothetical protein
MVTMVTILLAAAMTKVIEMIIGALEVAIRVIKGIAIAEQGVVVVIQVVVWVRPADSKVEQEENILVSMNQSLSRYVCLNLISIQINLTTNNRKQSKQPANMICSCSTSNMVFMTPQSLPCSFAQLL